MLLLTETNVPHKENISYFGGGFSLDAGQNGGCPDGPEAHLVYNFALPPLVLHAAVSGDAGPLRRWAGELPSLPEGNCFLNFLASHDGVGLTPAKGLVDEAAFAKTLETAGKRGALISMKSSQAGPIPYELNCSWADMVAPPELGTPELQARAFLLTYAAALSLPGLPAVYFHSWTGSRAWREGPGLLGYNRAINREKPCAENLEKELRRDGSFRSLVMNGFHRLFEFRSAEDAFDPASACKVLDGEGGIFALERESPDGRSKVIALMNFSAHEESFELPSIGTMKLEAHGTRWIAYDKTGIQRELIL
jgi:sucrose phosphorylase